MCGARGFLNFGFWVCWGAIDASRLAVVDCVIGGGFWNGCECDFSIQKSHVRGKGHPFWAFWDGELAVGCVSRTLLGFLQGLTNCAKLPPGVLRRGWVVLVVLLAAPRGR